MNFHAKVGISLAVGIIQGLAYARVLHSFGADAAVGMVIVLGIAGASGWATFKKVLP